MNTRRQSWIVLIGALLLACFASAAVAAVKVKSLCEVHYPSDDRIEWSCRKLAWQDTPQELFGQYWPDVLRFNRLDRRHFIGGRSIKVPRKLEQVYHYSPLPLEYPDAAREPKFILIDQSEMFLGAYE
jgi:hypothetical protein